MVPGGSGSLTTILPSSCGFASVASGRRILTVNIDPKFSGPSPLKLTQIKSLADKVVLLATVFHSCDLPVKSVHNALQCYTFLGVFLVSDNHKISFYLRFAQL